MEVTVCQCRKCGRYHVFEKIGVRDIHVCECGERIERWTHRMEKCETEKEPNEPLGAWKRSTPVWHGDNSPEMVTPNKPHKNKECESGWVWRKKRMEDGKLGFAFIDKNHKVNVVPIISINSKALIFQSDTKLTVWEKIEFEREYTQRLGIDCVVIDGGNKLALVIDG
nr:MAG TPA: hypothetical protein [Caudoviricetes sp.]